MQFMQNWKNSKTTFLMLKWTKSRKLLKLKRSNTWTSMSPQTIVLLHDGGRNSRSRNKLASLGKILARRKRQFTFWKRRKLVARLLRIFWCASGLPAKERTFWWENAKTVVWWVLWVFFFMFSKFFLNGYLPFNDELCFLGRDIPDRPLFDISCVHMRWVSNIYSRNRVKKTS